MKTLFRKIITAIGLMLIVLCFASCSTTGENVDKNPTENINQNANKNKEMKFSDFLVERCVREELGKTGMRL